MEETIQAHQKALCTKLWAMANALRGNMEAYEFKNYILGMIFYYYLSDRTEKFMEKNLQNDGLSYEEAWGKDEYRDALKQISQESLGYVIEPKYLFRKSRRRSTPSWNRRSARSRRTISRGCSPICSSTPRSSATPSRIAAR